MQIKQTKDYKKFKFLPGNRKPCEKHLTDLRSSIKNNNLTAFKPIVINDKWQIIDGQHTFLVCQELDIPVYYIQEKGLNIESVYTLNQSMSNWSGYDFLQMYAAKGLESYKSLENFINRWHLNLWDSIRLLTRGQGKVTFRQFKDGDLIIRNLEYAQNCVKSLHDLSAYCEKFKTRAFVTAFSKIFNTIEYDHQRLLRNLKKYNLSFSLRVSWREYIEEFNRIYNFKSNPKIDFKNIIKDYFSYQSKTK